MKDYVPTHQGLVTVNFGEPTTSSSYTSSLSLDGGARAGDVIAVLRGAGRDGLITRTMDVRYTSVQTGESDHIELNSDFVYMNHACDPSVELIITPATAGGAGDWDGEIVVKARREIEKGGDLTFFYPVTEWEMAQPFECACAAGKSRCLRTISGAKHLTLQQLQDNRGTVSPHILELKRRQQAQA
ncbi:hypothetical protein PYCC9005_002202 [Savitreella phatthalungensis]